MNTTTLHKPKTNAMSRRAALALLLAAPAAAHAAKKKKGDPEQLELAVPKMKRLSDSVWLAPLETGLWITTFTHIQPRLGWYPANGLIIAGEDGATVVDLGHTVEQGKTLLIAAAKLNGGRVARGLVTHYHEDRTGGGPAFAAVDIPVFGHPYSTGLAQAYGDFQTRAVRGLEKEAVTLGPVELFCPGPGHTRDNITAWHEPSGTLFGGCLIKSVTSKTLGNLDDADIGAYGATLQRLAERYPLPRRVIPGHGTIAKGALQHTIDLAAKLNSSAAKT